MKILDKMNKDNLRLILLFILVLAFTILDAQQYKFKWVKEVGIGSDISITPSFTVDCENNVYVIGHFSNTLNIDGTTLISNGESDIVVAKFNNDGALIWSRQFGGNSYDKGGSIICDSNNDLIFTGSFSSTVSFGDTSITSIGSADIFIAKYDSCGNYLWVQQAGGGNGNLEYSDIGKAIAFDINNNIYIAGSYADSTYFGDTVITSEEYLGGYLSSGFIAKYDSSGNFDWVRSHFYNSVFNHVTVDNENNLYVTGLVSCFDMENEGHTMVNILKYDESGEIIWEKSSEFVNNYLTYQNSGGRSITIDHANNVYVTLYNFGYFELDDISLGYGNHLIKFDPDGNIIWHKGIAGDLGVYDSYVKYDNEKIYITSSLGGTDTFGDTTLTGESFYNLLIAELDCDGNFNWARQVEGSYNSSQYGYQIIHLDNNDIIISGRIDNTAYFDEITITGIAQGFLAKLSPDTTDGLGNIDITPFINMFPNPAEEIIHIQIKDEKNSTIEIINIEGQRLYTKELNTNFIQIDISNYPQGIYFVKVKSEDFIKTEKIIKY